MAGGPNIVFTYLGRRGAMARFALELARATVRDGSSGSAFVVSRDNDRWRDLSDIKGVEVRGLELFTSGMGAITQLARALSFQQSLRAIIEERKAHWVVELMPHVWSPFLAHAVRKAGARRAVLLHDWRGHPGDVSALATSYLRRSALQADRLLTLSHAVTRDVVRARPTANTKTATLFHPDFETKPTPLAPSGPLRAVFIGRLLAYKGLDLFVEGAERAVSRGVALEVGVYGAGDISAMRPRLKALGAEIVNRWLSDAEIDAALQRFDIVAVTHREASQSGVAALAFGAGRPVLATPVGALSEQVAHERTGLVATRADGAAIADALERFADRAFLRRCAQSINLEAPQRSMGAFLEALKMQLRSGP